MTDANNALTTIHYDGTGGCNNGLATSTGYPLNLADSMTWDCNGGVPLVYTDVNSNTLSVLSYDSMWRPLSAQDQAGIVTNLSYSAGGLRDEKVLTFNGGTSTSDSVLYRDSLGRKAQSQVKRGPSATQYNTISYRYDANGRLNGVSVPCQVAANVNCTGGFNTQTYDALNRPYVSTSAAGGTATNTYQQNDVLSVLGPAPSGEVVKQKQYEYDGLGRLTSVCEITTSSGNGTCAQAVSKVGYWTRYQYDSMGRIVGVCQKTTQPLTVDCVQTPSSGQQTRILSYDGLGRKLSETNPESGTVNYTYDSASGCSGTSKGDLIKRVDARGAVTCYTYDNLHRVLTTSYSDGTPTKTFVYDAATVNGSAMSSPKGRLVEAYTGRGFQLRCARGTSGFL